MNIGKFLKVVNLRLTIFSALFFITLFFNQIANPSGKALAQATAQPTPFSCYLALYTTDFNGTRYIKGEPITTATWATLPQNIQAEFHFSQSSACDSLLPTPTPTIAPTASPTPVPTRAPTASPTPNPTRTPSPSPTPVPTVTGLFTNAINGVLGISPVYQCGTTSNPLSTGADVSNCISAVVQLTGGHFQGLFNYTTYPPTIFATAINDSTNDIQFSVNPSNTGFTLQSYSLLGTANTTDTSLVELLLIGVYTGTYPNPVITPSPTSTPTATPSPTPSPTPTHSPTPTPSPTPTATPSPTPSPTPTPTSSPTATPSPTPTPTASPTPNGVFLDEVATGASTTTQSSISATFSVAPVVNSTHILTAFVSYNSSFTITPPTGWTLLSSHVDSHEGVSAYYHVPQVGDSTTWSFTGSGSDYYALAIYDWNNVRPGFVPDVSAVITTTSSTPTTTGINPTYPNELPVAFLGNYVGAGATVAQGSGATLLNSVISTYHPLYIEDAATTSVLSSLAFTLGGAATGGTELGAIMLAPNPSPTPGSTATPTPSPTATPSPTPTPTATPTPTPTPTPSPTPLTAYQSPWPEWTNAASLITPINQAYLIPANYESSDGSGAAATFYDNYTSHTFGGDGGGGSVTTAVLGFGLESIYVAVPPLTTSDAWSGIYIASTTDPVVNVNCPSSADEYCPSYLKGSNEITNAYLPINARTENSGNATCDCHLMIVEPLHWVPTAPGSGVTFSDIYPYQYIIELENASNTASQVNSSGASYTTWSNTSGATVYADGGVLFSTGSTAYTGTTTNASCCNGFSPGSTPPITGWTGSANHGNISRVSYLLTAADVLSGSINHQLGVGMICAEGSSSDAPENVTTDYDCATHYGTSGSSGTGAEGWGYDDLVFINRTDAQINTDVSNGVLTPLQGMLAKNGAHYGWVVVDTGGYSGGPTAQIYTDKGNTLWNTVQTNYSLPSHNTNSGNAGVLASMGVPWSYLKLYAHSYKRCVVSASCPTATPTPTPSPTPSPTPTGTATPTPSPSPTSSIPGLAPFAARAYVPLPNATTYPSNFNSAWITETNAYAETRYQYPYNPFAAGYKVGLNNPSNVYSLLIPRTDYAGPGGTGYVLALWNTGTSAQTEIITPNQATHIDEYVTPSSQGDGSWIVSSINVNLAANASIYESIPAGTVHLFSLINNAAPPATPTPAPAITPTASPTPPPVVFPSDYPSPFDAYVKNLAIPQPNTTYYPFTTMPTITNPGAPAGTESFNYVTEFNEIFHITYLNTTTTNPTEQIDIVNPGGVYLIGNYTLTIASPSPSPCPYGQGGYINYSPAILYGICQPSNGTNVYQLENGRPSPNPSATLSPYPSATSVATPYYLSRVGGPFPAPNHENYFLHNPMFGQIPANPTISVNDANWLAASGATTNGFEAITVNATIVGDASTEGYSLNYVDSNPSDSVAYNLNCGTSPECTYLQGQPVFLPQDPQRQGGSDAHICTLNYQSQQGQCFWQVTNYPAGYQGASLGAVSAGDCDFHGDGTGCGTTASGIIPAIGIIRPEDLADLSVSTLPYAIQIAPNCSSNNWFYPSGMSDGGVGSTCASTAPPSGSRVFLNETPTHIIDCGLDPYSQKFWMTIAIYGAVITDTNPYATGFSVQTETDRDISKYGYVNPWQVIAQGMGGNATFNQGSGTYVLSWDRGSNNCINLNDLHFLDPGTVYVQGTVYP